MTKKTLFLDTMIYLHYRPVEDIVWPKVVGADEVVIVVPRVTIAELDKQKDHNSLRQLRERARDILQKIENWAQHEVSHIRDSVVVQTYHKRPRIEFAEYDLDSERSDEVLIATVLQYRQENPDADVLLVTQDTTPRITARGLGISVMSLPEEFKRPSAVDSVEQENRDLRRQLDRVRAASPSPKIYFCGEGEPSHVLKHRLSAPPELEVWIAREIAKLEEEHPRLYWGRRGHSLIDTPPSHEFDRYNDEREQFIREYAEYLRENADPLLARFLTIELRLELVNEGTAPADDLDVDLHFPHGFDLMTLDDVPEAKDAPPKPPKRPRTQRDIMHSEMTKLASLAASSFHSPAIAIRPTLGVQPNLVGPDIQGNDGYEAHWHAKRLKHDYVIELDPLAIVFHSFASAASFGIRYRIHAANLVDAVEDRLHIVIITE